MLFIALAVLVVVEVRGTDAPAVRSVGTASAFGDLFLQIFRQHLFVSDVDLEFLLNQGLVFFGGVCVEVQHGLGEDLDIIPPESLVQLAKSAADHGEQLVRHGRVVDEEID